MAHLTLDKAWTPAEPLSTFDSVTTPVRRTAVVGSGVSGLTAAYLLAREDQVTLFEADNRLGGHAHTHTVATDHGPVRVDSGFIVHNDRTYPHLQKLFAELGVAVRDTEMSMSICDPATGIEYAGGRGLRGFIARPHQLLNRDYLRMLTAVKRFHRDAQEFLDSSAPDDLRTFGEFVADYPRQFIDLYAIPLVSCVWSAGAGDAMLYPARSLFAFLANHGMLTVTDSPQWRTVVGGSSAYVSALVEQLPDVRRHAAVIAIRRPGSGGVLIRAGGGEERFDRVVLATHADQALALLADPTPEEKEVLGAFRYSVNEVLLHRDDSLLPTTRALRSSWNFTNRPGGAPPLVTYWMNRLQGLDERSPLLVTLNGNDRVDPKKVIAKMTYTHPIFDPPALAAQARLGALATEQTSFAGAYHGWGFHEDGCRSGVAAAASFGVHW